MVTHAVHPAGQADSVTDIGFTKIIASVAAIGVHYVALWVNLHGKLGPA